MIDIMKDTKLCAFCGEEIKLSAIKCKYCGSALSDGFQNQIAPDTQIKFALSNKYEILEIIGKGGMATVYKAVQKNLNRIVALKVVHPNLIHDIEFLNRFHREAQMAASLNHPNIVMIYDEGSLNGIHFISMEYLEGEDLHCIIKEKGKLSVEETINVIKPIAEALDFAHSKGLVHRDVKSANILVTKNGRPVLTDFGIAHAASGTKLTQAGSVIGTPEYMSPEQAEGKALDGRSDIFSLGVVMFECLTGKVPFKGDNPLTTIHGIIYDTTPALKSLNARIPGWLDSIVMCSLSKSPEERFPTGLILSVYLSEKKTPSGSFRKFQGKEVKNKLERQYLKLLSINSTKTLIGLILLFAIIIVTATVFYLKQESIKEKNATKVNEINQRNLSTIVKPNQDVTIIINEANRLINNGKVDEALNKYKEARAIDQNNPLVVAKIKEIDEFILTRNEIQGLVSSGDKLLEKKDLAGAHIAYERILELDKQNEYAKNKIRAIDQIQIASARDKSESNFLRYNSAGDSLFNIEQYEKAKVTYENGRKIKPNDKHIQDRLESIKTYLAMNEADFENLIAKADLDRNADKLSAAKDLYAEAMKLYPGNKLIQNKIDSLNIIIQQKISKEINNEIMYVQGGQFEMGSEMSSDDQKPAHLVIISSFNIDKYEVSVKQYKLFCNATGKNIPSAPPWGWNDDQPIVNVKWEDAAAYARWAGKRLPTEAEWEYAAHGGNKSGNFKYSGSNNANSVASFEKSVITKPKSVKSNNPNELGILNMSGNVWEWCNDYYDPEYYKHANMNNPRGPDTGKYRVIRGGAWNSTSTEILIKNRAYYNGKYDNSIGFRCVKD